MSLLAQAANAPTASGQVISQVISGAILLVMALVAKYLRDSNREARKLTSAFELHVQEDKDTFRQLKKYAKRQNKAQKRADQLIRERIINGKTSTQ